MSRGASVSSFVIDGSDDRWVPTREPHLVGPMGGLASPSDVRRWMGRHISERAAAHQLGWSWGTSRISEAHGPFAVRYVISGKGLRMHFAAFSILEAPRLGEVDLPPGARLEVREKTVRMYLDPLVLLEPLRPIELVRADSYVDVDDVRHFLPVGYTRSAQRDRRLVTSASLDLGTSDPSG